MRVAHDLIPQCPSPPIGAFLCVPPWWLELLRVHRLRALIQGPRKFGLFAFPASCKLSEAPRMRWRPLDFSLACAWYFLGAARAYDAYLEGEHHFAGHRIGNIGTTPPNPPTVALI
jgi:hypothetical protein